MTTAVIVQARRSSTRLPDKVLLPLAGQPVLEHVLRRCHAIPGADLVVCAIPDSRDCDVLGDIAERSGAQVFRGSESDVLARHAGAARLAEADTVMRVTSDCPLIDPLVCGDLLALLKREGADYGNNNDPPGWPHGLDCEAMRTSALFRAEAEASEAFDREHVTPWIRRQPDFRFVKLTGPGTGVGLRWTLDHPEDYAFFQAVFTAVGPNPSTAAVLTYLGVHPEVAVINASFSRPPLQAPS